MNDEPIRVLVVEDNPGDARLLWEALAEAQAVRLEPTHVARLDEALRRLEEEAFDVVLLDLGLPESQGLDTLTATVEAAPGVPIVVLTGLESEALAVQAVREGAQDYLVKGTIDANLLVRSLRYAIERHRAGQLQEANQRQISFVSIASHELRTPLTTILGFTELLLHRELPEATRREWLSHIYRESQSLTTITDDLLNVSRMQSGKLAVSLEELPLQEVVEEALVMVRPADGHHFSVVIPPDLPKVVADRDKLVQVLANLMDNAVKYSPYGGRITISALHKPEGECVMVGVADQGIGIAPEDQQRLFTTFHRIRRPETKGIRGTGLGLYIVKELVELMGGEVGLESELNIGSTFFFSLPTRRREELVAGGARRSFGVKGGRHEEENRRV